MKIRFTKMQGLGNDFVVLDAVRQRFIPSPAQVRWLADRHFGIGCDQVLIVEPPATAAADFAYRIFNADGGEVEQCGNGARCFVRFVHEQGLSEQPEIRVQTRAGLIVPSLQADGQVSVDMGLPEFTPARIPFLAQGSEMVQTLEIAGRQISIMAVSMGNPHAVQMVDDVDTAAVLQDGPLIEAHPRFPQRCNANFMQLQDRHNIRLRTFERGVGETLACGSGACASAATGLRLGLLDSPVCVSMPGGSLSIAWQGEGQNLRMTGPAVTVFCAEVEIPELVDTKKSTENPLRA